MYNIDCWFPRPYCPHLTNSNKDDWQKRTNQMYEAILNEADKACKNLDLKFTSVHGENPQWTNKSIAVIAFGDLFYTDVHEKAHQPKCSVLAITSGDLKPNWFRWYYSARLIGFTLARMIVQDDANKYVRPALVWMNSHLGRCVHDEFKHWGLLQDNDNNDIKFSDTATSADALSPVITKIVACANENERRTFVLVGYGDGYKYLLDIFGQHEKLKNCRLLTEPNYTVFSGTGNVENTECVTGIFENGQNVFETFCRRAVSLVSEYANNGGELSAEGFREYLLSLRFHRLAGVGIVNFREDGELFLPLKLYSNNFVNVGSANKLVEHNHDERTREALGALLLESISIINKFVGDGHSMPVALECTRDDAKMFCKLLDSHARLIINTFDVAYVDFISGFANTKRVFFSSDNDSDKRANLINWVSAEDMSVLKNGSSTLCPIQINLSEPDYEDNDTLRPYILDENAEGQSAVSLCEALYIVGRDALNKQNSKSYTSNLVVDGKVVLGFTSVLAIRKNVQGEKRVIDVVGEEARTRNVALLIEQIRQFKEDIGNECRYAYFIPYDSSLNTAWTSGSFLVARTKLSLFDLQIIKDILSRLFSVIEIGLQTRHAKIASLKSAIGSIMSRNGSHNIGSHVLAALSHNVGTMPDDRVLYQYIQHRMDYIATVTTDFPSWTLSTKMVGGLIKGFLEQRHLLEYISKSEGLHAFRFQDQNNTGKDWYRQGNTIQIHVKRTGYGVPDSGSVCFIEYPEDFPKANTSKKKSEQKESSDEDWEHYQKDSRLWLVERAREHLKYDLDIAIPGGVVGQHAFYTILENVIRNVAKHGWATEHSNEKKWDAENEEWPDNLKIWVDFSLDQDGRNVTVVIHDNISNVFKKPKFEGEDEHSVAFQEKAWATFAAYQAVLIEPLTIDEIRSFLKFLCGKSSSLPERYQALYQDLKQNDTWRPIKEFLVGVAPDNKEIELGNRIWMPLHHLQQIKLAQPFIDDNGDLRRENWGLAEMKISAGYLQMRSLAEIGGIDDLIDKNGDVKEAIIIPLPVKDGDVYRLGYTFKIRCPREVGFVVRTSEMLKSDRINLKKEDTNRLLIELQRRGVYVVLVDDMAGRVKPDDEYKEIFKIGQKRLSWDFRYVVLPSLPDTHDPCIPFRTLTRDPLGKEGFANIFPSFADYNLYRSRLMNLVTGLTDENVRKFSCDLKQAVYASWLRYWKEVRRTDIPGVAMCLNVQPTDKGGKSKDNGAERCLISDADVWQLVLDEMFRAYVRRMVQKELDPDYDDTVVKAYMVVLAILKKKGAEGFDDQQPRVSMMAQLVSWFDDEFRNIWDQRYDWFNVHKHELDIFLESCRNADAKVKKFDSEDFDFMRQENQNDIFALHADVKNWVNRCLEDKTGMMQISVPTIDSGAEEHAGIRMAMLELVDVFEYVNVLVRKYEERIMTLPESFKPETETKSGSQSTFIQEAAKAIGVNLVLPGSSFTKVEQNEKTLNYIRHFIPAAFDAESMEYAEPLSGTQSYLNALGSLVSPASATFMAEEERAKSQSFLSWMYENALSRILIVDERTADFVMKHTNVSEVFAQMGIWVFDHNSWKRQGRRSEAIDSEVQDSVCQSNEGAKDDKNKSSLLKSKKESLLKDDELHLSASLSEAVLENSSSELGDLVEKFDVLIIHQGLIDKWFPAVARNVDRMERFLNNLKILFPYVVITTGRGTPANTPETARIIPFSVIEKTLFRSSPEKLVLMEAVMNVLPRGGAK